MIKKVLKSVLLKRQIKGLERSWTKSFYNELYKVCNIKRLTPEQYRLVKQYYEKNFQRKIPLLWHEYYYSMTNIFDVRFLPDGIFYPYILPNLNDQLIERGYLDKNHYEQIFPNVLQPSTILKNINGYYYKNGESITEQEAVDICSDLDVAIIKPTLDTFQGWNVRRFSSSKGKTSVDDCSVKDLFCKYGRNFIVQEAIEQHSVMASLNKTSVNTIRIVTLRRGDEIIPLSSIVRIGRAGSVVDNGHAGGYCCGIEKDGRLKERGYICQIGESRTCTDMGTSFRDVRIPLFSDIVELSKRLHLQLPYLNLIGWDFCVDSQNRIVLIEFNATPSIDIMQLCNGPFFKEYTDEMLQMAAKNVYKLEIKSVLERGNN